MMEIAIPWIVVKVAITAATIVAPIVVWFGVYYTIRRTPELSSDRVSDAMLALILLAMVVMVVVGGAALVTHVWNSL